MPRELQHLVLTKIRRIAHSPEEAECIARLLLMQVILVCVVHAAQKTWYAGRMACDEYREEQVTGGSLPLLSGGTPGCERDPADSPGIPFRTLWECIARLWGTAAAFPGRNFSPGGYLPEPLTHLIHRPVSG